MRIKAAILLCIVSVGIPAVLSPALASAVTGPSANSGSSTSSSPTATLKEPRVEVQKLTEDNLQARIDLYKKGLKLTMSAATLAKIGTACTSAQTKLKTLGSSNEKVVTARMNVYNTLMTKLQSIIDRSGAQQLDVTTLTADLAVLKTKVTTFESQLKTYRQDLADVVALKCTGDAAGFEAALTAARTDQAAVLATAKDIRSYMSTTIKPQLEALKKQLDAQATPKTGAN